MPGSGSGTTVAPCRRATSAESSELPLSTTMTSSAGRCRRARSRRQRSRWRASSFTGMTTEIVCSPAGAATSSTRSTLPSHPPRVFRRTRGWRFLGGCEPVDAVAPQARLPAVPGPPLRRGGRLGAASRLLVDRGALRHWLHVLLRRSLPGVPRGGRRPVGGDHVLRRLPVLHL